MKSEGQETLSLPPLTSSFRFGNAEQHEFKVVFSYLGREQYFVNDKLHHSHFSVLPRGVRKFKAHGHEIEIRIDVGFRKLEAVALVDGVVVNDNLLEAAKQGFAEIEKRMKEKVDSTPSLEFNFKQVAIQAFAWCAALMVLTLLFRTVC